MLKIWGDHASPWLRLWRIRDGHLTNITNREEKRDNSYSPIYDFCEKLAHCANAKNIECEAMWLFLKNTHLVHPCTPHLRGTPLENPGTPWGVRYTRLTSTGINHRCRHIEHCVTSRMSNEPRSRQTANLTSQLELVLRYGTSNNRSYSPV